MEGWCIMTIMPQWKICPRCHKPYDWNPDVGVMRCPNCMKNDMKKLEKLKKVFGKDKEDINTES